MKKKTPPSREGQHKHHWRTAFVETKNGTTIKSFLRCTVSKCDYEDSWRGKGWKTVDGAFDKPDTATYAVVNSKY